MWCCANHFCRFELNLYIKVFVMSEHWYYLYTKKKIKKKTQRFKKEKQYLWWHNSKIYSVSDCISLVNKRSMHCVTAQIEWLQYKIGCWSLTATKGSYNMEQEVDIGNQNSCWCMPHLYNLKSIHHFGAEKTDMRFGWMNWLNVSNIQPTHNVGE